MKNQAQFTPHAAETWAATLSNYPTNEVNRAILEFGLSADPFPDLGKIVLRCEQLRREREGTTGRAESQRVSMQTLQRIAASLEIDV